MLMFYFGIREPQNLTTKEWAVKIKMLERIRTEEAEKVSINALNWR